MAPGGHGNSVPLPYTSSSISRWSSLGCFSLREVAGLMATVPHVENWGSITTQAISRITVRRHCKRCTYSESLAKRPIIIPQPAVRWERWPPTSGWAHQPGIWKSVGYKGQQSSSLNGTIIIKLYKYRSSKRCFDAARLTVSTGRCRSINKSRNKLITIDADVSKHRRRLFRGGPSFIAIREPSSAYSLLSDSVTLKTEHQINTVQRALTTRKRVGPTSRFGGLGSYNSGQTSVRCRSK